MVRRSVDASIGFTSSPSASARLARKRSASRSRSSRIDDVGQPAGRGLEPQVDRHRDATHVGDLHVEHDDVGLVVLHRLAHVLAARDLDHTLTGAEARGLHQVTDPLGVGGYEDGAHGRSRYPRRCHGPTR